MNVADLFASFGYEIDAATVARVDATLTKTEERMKSLADSAKLSAALTNAYGDSGKALALIGLDADKAKAAMAGATKGTFSWGNAIVVVNQALGIATKLYGGVQRVIGSVFGLAHAAEAQAAQAIELSQQLGISAEAVQELGFASSQSGGSVETMTVGLRTLSNMAQNAAKGSKDAAKAFHEVGLNAKDVTSGKVPLDQALGQIADKFQAMPDGAKKSALAVDLFGRQGAKLIPLLNEGSAGVAKLRQEARDLGVVIDNETAKALEEFGDENDKVKAQLDGIRNQAIAALLPALSDLVKGFQAWIKANREMLVGALTGALRGLIAVLRVVAVAVSVVVDVIKFYIEHSTLAIVLLAALAAAFLYMGITAAAAWIMALGPVGLVILAITALILLMPLIVKAVEAAGRGIARALDWMGDRFKALGRGIESVFRAIGRFFVSIGQGIRSAWGAVLDWIEARIQSVKNMAADVADWVRDHIPLADKVLGARTAGATAAPTLSSGRTASVDVRHTATVNVNAPNADTETVKTAVREAFKPMWEAEMRTAADGIG